MNPLQRFSAHIKQLTVKANQFDHQSYSKIIVRFDHGLFKCRASRLLPYVLEAKTTLQLIADVDSSKINATDRIEHLSQKLLDQISAITKVLDAPNLDQTKLDQTKLVQTNDEQIESLDKLSQDLAQHLEWEERLYRLVEEKQNYVNKVSSENAFSAKQALKIARERLARCQSAINDIENRINKRKVQ